MLLRCVLSLFAATVAASAATVIFPQCPVAPLSRYLLSPTYECAFGQVFTTPELTFQFTAKDFSFSATNVDPNTGLSTGAPVATPAQITVTPAPLLGQPFRFESPLFDIGPFQYVKYVFGFTIDPAPPIIPGFEGELFTDTPVFPGNATLNFHLCRGSKWFPNSFCPGGPNDIYSFNLFHSGNPSGNVLTGGVTFDTPTNVVGVIAELVLDTRQGGTSQITGIGAGGASPIPEPSTLLFFAAGAVALIVRSKK